MRKIARLLLFLSVMVFLVTGALQAVDDPTAGVTGLARYFPPDTLIFGALRTDEAFIDELDSLVAFFSDLIPDTPPITFRQALNFLPQGDRADEVLAWMGDGAAFGLTSFEAQAGSTEQNLYAVIELADAQAAEAYLTNTYAELSRVESDGESVILESENGLRITISGDLLIVSVKGTAVALPEGETLLESADYAQIIGELPASSYNVLLYVDVPGLRRAVGLPDNLVEIGIAGSGEISLNGLVYNGPLAIGGALLDGDTLTLDIAQRPNQDAATAPVDTLDPAFARFIPADANAVIHATNFTRLYNDLIIAVEASQRAMSEQIASFAFPTPTGGSDGFPPMTPFPTPQPPGEAVQQTLLMVGIDFEQDILSWTTGDYALFVRADLVPIVSGAIEYRLDLVGNYDFGLVVEATDPAKAAQLVAHLRVLLQSAPPSDQFAVSNQQINGQEVIVINLQLPVTFPFYTYPDNLYAEPVLLPLEVVIGANDDVFFVATRASAENILARQNTLDADPTYAAASAYFLPNPASTWYADGEGILVVLANPLLLGVLGPSIGDIFTDLGALDTPTPTPSPTPSPTPDSADTAEQVQPLVDLIAAIEHGTISAAVTDDGTNLVRFTLTLNR